MSKQQLQNIPIFLCHLYKILHDSHLSDILCWDFQRKGFIIKDHNRLCDEVLPKFYRHKNFSSFIRQLNMYGFKKMRNKNQLSFFFNQQFDINNQFQQLKNIKRRVGLKKDNESKQNVESQVSFQEMKQRNNKKKVAFLQESQISNGQAEQKMVQVLRNITNQKQVARKIVQMKKKIGLKDHLYDDQFIQRVCKMAGVQKPPQQDCLSQLSIEEQINDGNDKKSIYESMKLVESGKLIEDKIQDNQDLI